MTIDERAVDTTELALECTATRDLAPERGYVVVEVDLRPPGTAVSTLKAYDSLEEIALPQPSDLVVYLVFDADGTVYTRADLAAADPGEGGDRPAIASEQLDAVDVDELATLLTATDGALRLEALQTLEAVVAERPATGLELLPELESALEADEASVRAAALACLDALADEAAAQLTPLAERVVATIDGDADETVLERALSVVAAIADPEPGAVVDAIPRLAALLQTDPPGEREAILAIQRIAQEHPAAVLPVTTQLRETLADEEPAAPVTTLAALGTISKAYPHVTIPAVPRLFELLDADATRVRANAAGLLADLAGEYPAEVRPIVPRAVDLLTDGDLVAQYNATSILARVAADFPADVAPVSDALVGALDAELAIARANACRALGYVRAEAAARPLAATARDDPDQEVREVAAWALGRIPGDDP